MSVNAVLVLLLLADDASARPGDARDGAWDRSVAHERARDLGAAEQVMRDAWGSSPDNYWASLRLAYLALLQGRYDEAVRRYGRLRDRPEATLDADLARGYQAATAAVSQAGAVAISPELWAIATANSLGRYRYQGWGAYAHVPVRLGEHLGVRAAGRYISASRTSGRSPWAFTTQGDAWTLDEEYLAIGWNGNDTRAEAALARSATSGEAPILGGAAGLQLGHTWGGTMQAAFLRKGGIARNLQIRPGAFVWPSPRVGIQAGGRATVDDRGRSLSGSLGLSVLRQPVALSLEGFVGTERWAFDFAGPSIMSFDSQATYGGTLTALLTLTTFLRLAVQGDAARLHEDSAWGSYWSVSLGIQLGPELR